MGFLTKGGFKSDNARGAKMTADSNKDIAWVRTGREKLGTQRNIKRRFNQHNITRITGYVSVGKKGEK